MSTGFVGVLGSGNIGRDPFDPRSFSGISRSLFRTLQSRGALLRAFGVEAAPLLRALSMARTFRPSRSAWRTAFYLDPRYYRQLTKAVKKSMIPQDLDGTFLQLGAYYDVPALSKGRAPCMSYHDGNVAQAMASPDFPPELRPEAEAAFEWEKRVYEGLDAIFAMSEYLRQSFINDFGVPANRVFNVGAGPNFEIPQELPEKDYGKQKILFVGIDFERKGGPQLLDAFRIVRQTHRGAELHIVGPHAPPQQLGEHRDGVVFHGFLSKGEPTQREQFFKLLQDCTLFTMPSRYEPYGVAVVEAMVYGMPVIATDRWAFPELVGDNGACVPLDDVDAMADRIGWLLDDPDKRAELGVRARKRAIERFNWDRVARQMIDVAGLD